MNCRRAFDLDLAGFLARPGASEFDDFREHYPDCADCAAEVRAWTDLHLQLQAASPGAGSGHPSEELLLRFEQQPASLTADEKSDLDEHLAACVPCRDELASLRSFDFAAAGEVPSPLRRRSPALHFAGLLRRFLWHPAFAYGLVLLLSLPLLFWQSTRFAPAPPVDRDLVANEPPPHFRAELKRKDAENELAFLAVAEERQRREHESADRLRKSQELRDEAMKEIDEQMAARVQVGNDPRASDPEVKTEIFVGARRRIASEPSVGGQRVARAPDAPVPTDVGRGALSFEGIFRPLTESVRHELDWTILPLSPGSPAEVSRSGLGNGLALQIPLTETQRGTSNLEIRIRLPGTEQDLLQRFRIDAATEQLEVRLAASWLSPGDYVVGLHSADNPAVPLQTFVFSVR